MFWYVSRIWGKNEKGKFQTDKCVLNYKYYNNEVMMEVTIRVQYAWIKLRGTCAFCKMNTSSSLSFSEIQQADQIGETLKH